MVLNRNPENYFAEVEQAAFSPANFVPGIAASPDKLLQGRLFSYHDTHRHRLGPNYHLIPINRPKAAKVDNYQRDSYMQVGSNFGDRPNYYPNSFGGPEPSPDASDPAFEVSGEAARQPYAHPNDDFFQSGELYRRVMTDSDRDHLIGNITTHLCNAQKRIQLRQAAIFYKADAEYGRRVAEGLGLDVKEVERLAAMSQEERAKATAQ
jgi:catalase